MEATVRLRLGFDASVRASDTATLLTCPHDGSAGPSTQVIAYMLSPDTSEGASSFIGRLITLVILKAGDALGDYVSDLLVSVLEKLLQAKTLTVIEVSGSVIASCQDPTLRVRFAHALSLRRAQAALSCPARGAHRGQR